jgi:cob(I)alamin adenosyltransferase
MTAADPPAGNDNTGNSDYVERMRRRKAIQDQRMSETVTDQGLVIVHTGAGKGKTTAALGMVLRSLGHGHRVAIIQFIKGAWEPAEKRAFESWGSSCNFTQPARGLLGKPRIARAIPRWLRPGGG